MVYLIFSVVFIFSYPFWMISGCYIMDHLDRWIDNAGEALSPARLEVSSDKKLSWSDSPEFYAAQCEVEDYLLEKGRC